jgi:hypothetical protein
MTPTLSQPELLPSLPYHSYLRPVKFMPKRRIKKDVAGRLAGYIIYSD